MDRDALEEASWREKGKGTSKVMVCLVAAQWLFVEAQCFRGEGRLRRINGRGLC